MKWSIVILAGGVLPPDLARLTQKTYQAELSFGDRRCLDCVVEACRGAGFSDIVVSAPPVLHNPALGVQWANAGSTNIQTALWGAEAVGKTDALLFLPCDVPLLASEHLRAFIAEVEKQVSFIDQPWVAIGLSPKEWVQREFPGASYHFMKFVEGRFASGALYASSPPVLKLAQEFLLAAGERRKSLYRLLRVIGWRNVFRYLAGKVSLEEADAFTQKFWGVKAVIVRNCHPFTTMDCDTLSDYRYILGYLQ
ncbi:MAG: NTP transferase domain-containing protein [Candidatus Caldarchaeum sp.]